MLFMCKPFLLVLGEMSGLSFGFGSHLAVLKAYSWLCAQELFLAVLEEQNAIARD